MYKASPLLGSAPANSLATNTPKASPSRALLTSPSPNSWPSKSSILFLFSPKFRLVDHLKSFITTLSELIVNSIPLFFSLPTFLICVRKPVVPGTSTFNSRSLVFLAYISTSAEILLFKIPISKPTSTLEVVSHFKSGLANCDGC